MSDGERERRFVQDVQIRVRKKKGNERHARNVEILKRERSTGFFIR